MSRLSVFVMSLLATTWAATSMFYNRMPSPLSQFVDQSDTDRTQVNLGVRFSALVAGEISAIVFLKNNSVSSNRVFTLYTDSGTVVRRQTLPRGNETAGRFTWQTCQFDPPVPISANTTYIASYFSSGYLATPSYFNRGSPSTVVGQLRLLSDNSRFVYASNAQFPSQSYPANYWIDVVFESPDPTTTTTTAATTTATATTTTTTTTTTRTTTTTKTVPTSSSTLPTTTTGTTNAEPTTNAANSPRTSQPPASTTSRTTTNLPSTTSLSTSSLSAIGATPATAVDSTAAPSTSFDFSSSAENSSATTVENSVSDEQPVSSDLIIGVGVGLCLLIALLTVLLFVCLARRRKKEDPVDNTEPIPGSSGYYPVLARAESAPRTSEYASVASSLNGSAQQNGVEPRNHYAYGSISNSIVYAGADVGNTVVYDNTLDLLKMDPPSPPPANI